MSLKLVADAADVIPLDIHNPRIIPQIARTFADRAEAGAYGDISRAVVVLETDAGPLTFYWGDDLTHYEAIGMFHMAAHIAASDGIDAFQLDE